MSIKKNSYINVIGAIAPLLVFIFTVPLYLDFVGAERFGVISLMWIVANYVAFFELGIGKALSNNIAAERSNENNNSLDFFWAAILINLSISLAITVLAGILVGIYQPSVPNISHEVQKEIGGIWFLIILVLPITLMGTVFRGALEGAQKFLVLNVLNVASTTSIQVLPIVFAMRWGPSLEVVIPVAIFTRLFFLIIFFVVCLIQLRVSVKPKFSTKAAKKLVKYGIPASFSGVSGMITDSLDKFLIGFLLGPLAFTFYNIPHQLVGKLRIIPTAVAVTLFPLISSQSEESSVRLVSKAIALIVAIMFPISVFLMLFITLILKLWIGPEFAAESAHIARIVLIGNYCSFIAIFSVYFLLGKRRTKLLATIHVLQIVPYGILMFVITKQFGIIGAAWVWTVRALADMLIFLLVVSRFNIPLRSYLAPIIFLFCAYVAIETNLAYQFLITNIILITVFLVSGFFIAKDYLKLYRERSSFYSILNSRNRSG